jgi:PTH1 family peptidyl-tRNA hydrolase
VKLLVGLGNPGEECRLTRHNAGFMVVEEFARRHEAGTTQRRARSLVQEALLDGREVLIVRPQTWMNRSGEAVAALMDATGAGPEDLLVVCDDLYLDFGALRFRARGSDGGHNGLASVIEAIGTREFARLRVGVGPAETGVTHADYVLAPFTRAERGALPDVVERAATGAALALAAGIAVAMNRFNRRGVRAEAGT